MLKSYRVFNTVVYLTLYFFLYNPVYYSQNDNPYSGCNRNHQ